MLEWGGTLKNSKKGGIFVRIFGFGFKKEPISLKGLVWLSPEIGIVHLLEVVYPNEKLLITGSVYALSRIVKASFEGGRECQKVIDELFLTEEILLCGPNFLVGVEFVCC